MCNHLTNLYQYKLIKTNNVKHICARSKIYILYDCYKFYTFLLLFPKNYFFCVLVRLEKKNRNIFSNGVKFKGSLKVNKIYYYVKKGNLSVTKKT